MRNGNLKIKGFTLIELLVIILITSLLAMPLLALRGQSRERTWQTRCTANLRIIYAAIQNYADDNDGWICPFFDGAGMTWEKLLKPYTYGGDNPIYGTRLPDGTWKFWQPMIFYCPKRNAMGQSWSNSGYITNYGASVYVMSAPGFPGPFVGLKRFEDFQDHDNIAMLFEVQGHVASPGTSAKYLEYVHYGRTNVLMLNGTVKRFQKRLALHIKLNDYKLIAK